MRAHSTSRIRMYTLCVLISIVPIAAFAAVDQPLCDAATELAGSNDNFDTLKGASAGNQGFISRLNSVGPATDCVVTTEGGDPVHVCHTEWNDQEANAYTADALSRELSQCLGPAWRENQRSGLITVSRKDRPIQFEVQEQSRTKLGMRTAAALVGVPSGETEEWRTTLRARDVSPATLNWPTSDLPWKGEIDAFCDDLRTIAKAGPGGFESIRGKKGSVYWEPLLKVGWSEDCDIGDIDMQTWYFSCKLVSLRTNAEYRVSQDELTRDVLTCLGEGWSVDERASHPGLKRTEIERGGDQISYEIRPSVSSDKGVVMLKLDVEWSDE